MLPDAEFGVEVVYRALVICTRVGRLSSSVMTATSCRLFVKYLRDLGNRPPNSHQGYRLG